MSINCYTSKVSFCTWWSSSHRSILFFPLFHALHSVTCVMWDVHNPRSWLIVEPLLLAFRMPYLCQWFERANHKRLSITSSLRQKGRQRHLQKGLWKRFILIMYHQCDLDFFCQYVMSFWSFSLISKLLILFCNPKSYESDLTFSYFIFFYE